MRTTTLVPQRGSRKPSRKSRGQTTAEYALVLLGAATIAMLVIAWASSTGSIGNLFDTVVSAVTNMVA